jgi:anti-sigma regulatory factor (Ser/Thr protein kinase)
MTPETTAFRHSAYVYEEEDEYLARSVAFLRDGLEAGEASIFAQTRDRIAMVRDALGPDAERVTFVNIGSTYTRPARAVAAYYRTFLAHLHGAPSVRALAEFQPGPPGDDWDRWIGYEAITNLAYAHLPVWVVCTYNANRLPDKVVDGAFSTHADVLGDGSTENDHFEDPRALVRRLTPEPEPLAGLRSYAPGDDLEAFRTQLARELTAEDVPEARALEMLVAGTEIAANAVRHGDGIEEIRLGRADGRFVCEVVDRGSGFDDPIAGYLAPREGIGTGLWVARQVAWRLEFFHSPRGFTVRIWL